MTTTVTRPTTRPPAPIADLRRLRVLDLQTACLPGWQRDSVIERFIREARVPLELARAVLGAGAPLGLQ